MLRNLALLLLLFCLTFSTGYADSSNNTCSNPAITTAVNQYVGALVTDNQIPGAEVGVYLNGTKCFFSYGYAKILNGKKIPPDENTIFEIGSITKIFTATLLMLAQSNDMVNLDDPVITYKNLPSWLVLNPIAGQMTFVELADFSAGLPDMPTNLNPKFNSQPVEQVAFKNYPLAAFARFLQYWAPTS